ncbi:putative disease resistance protein At4g19050 [Humulus lupulus]|uniref:putative disease resistance protein At4g19050 n=1 Tax=Humulus lupulus TaxID=3486 RepID=UPI002B418122|nr:putative disease resistance protein At4g19050 [Humulus lupulus]
MASNPPPPPGATTPQPQPPQPPAEGTTPQPQPPPGATDSKPQPTSQPLEASPEQLSPPPVEATVQQSEPQPLHPPSPPLQLQLPPPEAGATAPQPQLQPLSAAEATVPQPQLQSPPSPQSKASQPQPQPPPSAEPTSQPQPPPLEAATSQLPPTPAAETAAQSQLQQPPSPRTTASQNQPPPPPSEESNSQVPPSPGGTASQAEPLQVETAPKPPHETPTEPGESAPQPQQTPPASGATASQPHPEATAPQPQPQQTPPASGATASQPQRSSEANDTEPQPQPHPEATASGTSKSQPQHQPQPLAGATAGAPQSQPQPPAGATVSQPRPPVEVSTEEKLIKDITESLKNPQTTIIFGEAGVGKTYMAKKILKGIKKSKNGSQTSLEVSFAVTLWLSLNKRYDHPHPDQQQMSSLIEDLARQLSVLPRIEGGFEDDDEEVVLNQDNNGLGGGEEEEKKKKKKEKSEDTNRIKTLEANISDKLAELMKDDDPECSTKNVLLVLDGDPSDVNIRFGVICKLKGLMKGKESNLRVLITTRVRDSDDIDNPIEIPLLKSGEFLKLMLEQISPKENDSDKIKTLFEGTIFKDAAVEIQMPAAVAVLVGKALNKFRKDGATCVELLEKALKKATELKTEKKAEIMTCLACSVYEMLPSDDKALINCCWYSKKFFSSIKNQCVHYNELIAHWILEGCLESSNSIEKAYEEGYHILKELRYRSLLKKEDEEFVKMEEVAFDVPDLRYKGFDETAMLGLPEVLAVQKDDQEWLGDFGRISVADGMIRTICGHNNWGKVSTLFIHGNRLCREVPTTFFEYMKELQTLVLINPRLKTLESMSISNLPKLQVLVVRGCDVLDTGIDSISKFSLTVLEISGAKSLKNLPDGLFDNMSHLRSLNLSEVQVKLLPKSFTNLTQLQWLILRGCSRLEEMPNVKTFKDLKVLDMAGVSSLKVFKDKNFGSLKCLRVLDYSQAKIAPSPFVHDLHELTRLTLIGCSEITRVPHFDKLSKLQILELSGAKKLVEFYQPSLENKSVLRILDLSKTKISQLPSSFNDLPRLENLNLSHMSSLEDLTNVSFSRFRCLQIFNLSNTPMKTLPSLSNLSNLRELFLKDCKNLEKLPEMEELTNLEILDVSGATSLKEIQNEQLTTSKLRKLLLKDCESLQKLPALKDSENLEELNLSGCKVLKINKQSFEGRSLRILNLSETQIQNLSSLSTPNLRQLILAKCTELKELPLSSLSKLEELNLSGPNKLQGSKFPFNNIEELHTLDISDTSIALLSNFSECTKLKKLSLRKCCFVGTNPQLEKLTLLEVLDLSDTAIVPDQSSPQNSNDHVNQGNKPLILDGEKIEHLLKLTDLDLRGTQLKNFPYWISKLTNLQRLRLPDLESFKELDWGKIKHLPDDLNWEECGIFTLDAKNTEMPSISINGTKMFNALKKKSVVWDNCFKKICIFVYPLNKNGEDEDIYRKRDQKFFKNIYFKMIHCPDSYERFLEIRGFNFKTPLNDLEDALMNFDCLSFIEDDGLMCLADVGIQKLEKLTSLWLERCPEIEFIFSEKKPVTVSKSFNLLWVSNLPKLTSLYIENVDEDQFKNLKQLYLDCCPKLESVFNSTQVPEKLEKLHVKFCDKLSTLFNFGSSEHKLLNLEELHLLELPELASVGAKLPGLQKAKIKGCPKFDESSFRSSLELENKTINEIHVEENREIGARTRQK